MKRLWRKALVALLAPPLSPALCLRGPRRRPAVALTFDDGPRPDFTPAVLDLLAQAGAQATFFLEGQRVEKHPELARRIRAAGHEIGNHGYAHDGSPLRVQVERCAKALSDCGLGTRLFRPPRGRIGVREAARLAAAGYRTVLWSFDARDSMRHEGKWRGPAPDYGRVRAGDIVLLHDDNPVCAAELPPLLALLREKRLVPVTVSELLRGRAGRGGAA